MMKSLLTERRRRSIIAFEMIRLDRAAAEPLHQQLYRQIRQARTETGVTPIKLSLYCTEGELDPAFLFGFAAWSRAQIREGLAKLASAFERLKRGSAG